MPETLIISENEVRDCLNMGTAIKSAREAFRGVAEGKISISRSVELGIRQYSGEVHVKSGYAENARVIGTKVAAGFYGNPKINLPSSIGVMLLFDISTGLPLAILDAGYLTDVRTGAAGAVAASVLARKNSKVVAIVGTGIQARMQVLALKEIYPIELLKVYGRNAQNRERYSSEMREKLDSVELQTFGTVEAAVLDADIIVTATSSTTPLVRDEWIHDGVHINAIGADSKGKQELDPQIMKRAKIVVDNREQCVSVGEIQHAISNKIIDEAKIHAEVGEILLGMKKGRENDAEITLFDSTGISALDIVTANEVFKLVKARGLGKSAKLLNA